MQARVSRRLGVTSFLVVVALAVVAGSSVLTNSHSGFNAGMYAPVGNVGQIGGELRLGSASRCDSLDPARSFDPWCAVILRTFTRNVMAFAGAAGAAGVQTQPDLAAKAPQVSADAMVWTFTLRPNVRWDDGTEVTVRDVRYSVERLFVQGLGSPVPSSVLCYLGSCSTGLPDYEGPFKRKNGHLSSIKTYGKYRISFHLTRPNAQFDRILAMPQLGVVEQARETRLRQQHRSYASNPASSGPFVVKVLKGETIARFTPNRQWSQSTDFIRRPLVTSMTWTLFASHALADQALMKGDIDVKVDGGLGIPDRVNALKKDETRANLDIAPVNVTNFLAVVPGVEPLGNVACRQAIDAALDKEDLVQVRGGEAVTSLATSMIPVGVAGWSGGSNPLSTRQGTGDLQLAKSKLSECGYPDGFEVSLAYVDLGVGRATYASVQKSLARVGIIVDPAPFDDFTTFFARGAGSPDYVHSQNIGLVLASWGPDSFTASSFWAPLVDGRLISTFANQNYPELNDGAINELLDRLTTTTNWADQETLSAQVQNLVAAQSVYLPFATDHSVLYRSARLAHAYAQLALDGQYDLVNLGLAIH